MLYEKEVLKIYFIIFNKISIVDKTIIQITKLKKY